MLYFDFNQILDASISQDLSVASNYVKIYTSDLVKDHISSNITMDIYFLYEAF